ncbi:hypothetical protein [Herbiconiux sp. A18JL235]|uniref:DUF4352 domain-containing protein n=1 Tax=Herbiconiux sp. A18JL235 TaxID=3152363 RepID=A0AB39BCR7_9MICO
MPSHAPSPVSAALRHPAPAWATAGVAALAVVVALVPGLLVLGAVLGVLGLALGVAVLARRGGPARIAAAGAVVSAAVVTVSLATAAVGVSTGLPQLAAEAGAEGFGAPSTDVAQLDTVAARFGQTVTYDDGLQLYIADPVEFVPSSEARGAGQAVQLAFTIVVYNGTDAEVALRESSSVSAAGQQADAVVDPVNGATGVPPVSTLAPGETVSYVEAFSLASGDAVFAIAPGADYLPARFTR